MIEALDIGVLLTAVGVGLAAWRWPAAAAAFVLTGQIPYYALLAALSTTPSAVRTGLVFGVPAAVALIKQLLLRPARKPRNRAHRLYLGLFFLFVAIWYLRWFQDPPGSTYSVGDESFVQRAFFFMLVFAILPFLLGLSLRSESARAEIIRWIHVFGAIGFLSIFVFWTGGVSSQHSEFTGTWEPIPFLTGIILSINIGIAGLALYVAWFTRPRWPWRLAALAVAVAATAILVRVGQRGPFLFFLVSIALYHGIAHARGWGKRFAYLATAALIVAQVALIVGEASSGRATDVTQYSAERNTNRIALASVAFDAIAQRPFVGWGGSLIGRPVHDGYWQYSHVLLLDPLLETGLLGAIPFCALLLLILYRTWRDHGWFLQSSATYPVLLVLAAYAFLESQVSGHIAMARHFWLLAALLSGTPLPARSPGVSPSAPRVRGNPAAVSAVHFD